MDSDNLSIKDFINEHKINSFPCHSQRNNKLFPFSACMTTSFAAVFSYYSKLLGIDIVHDDDSVFAILSSKMFIEKYLLWTKLNYNWLNKHFLKKRLVSGKFTKYNHLNNIFDAMIFLTKYISGDRIIAKEDYYSFEEIKKSIDIGNPVVITTNFTKSGHIVQVTGYKEEMGEGYLFIHDPYGDYRTKYTEKENGWYIPVNYTNFTNGLRNGYPFKNQQWKEKSGMILGVMFKAV